MFLGFEKVAAGVAPITVCEIRVYSMEPNKYATGVMTYITTPIVTGCSSSSDDYLKYNTSSLLKNNACVTSLVAYPLGYY